MRRSTTPTLVRKARRRAKEIGISGKIHQSDRKGKKVHFGQQKRSAYRARASKIRNKEGQYTYEIRNTPNYLAYNILW